MYCHSPILRTQHAHAPSRVERQAIPTCTNQGVNNSLQLPILFRSAPAVLGSRRRGRSISPPKQRIQVNQRLSIRLGAAGRVTDRGGAGTAFSVLGNRICRLEPGVAREDNRLSLRNNAGKRLFF
jgi:hypothetical protein